MKSKFLSIRVLALTGAAALATLLTAPAARAAVTETDSNQTGDGVNAFTPTYTVPGNDMMLGLSATAITPSAVYFSTPPGTDAVTGGVTNLTDGTFGSIGAPGATGANSVFAVGGTGAGTSLIYTLAAPSNITSFVTLAGWQDQGRDSQSYTVLYSTDGTNFTTLATVNYVPPNASHVQNATQVVLNGFGTLAGVTAVEFNFNAGLNGYEGYNELAAIGTASVVPEPSTWACSLGMLGVLGLVYRHRSARRA